MWIKVAEAHKRLSGAVSKQTLYRLLQTGELAGTIVGKVHLIDAESLDDLIGRGRIGLLTGKVPPPATHRQRRAC